MGLMSIWMCFREEMGQCGSLMEFEKGLCGGGIVILAALVVYT